MSLKTKFLSVISCLVVLGYMPLFYFGFRNFGQHSHRVLPHSFFYYGVVYLFIWSFIVVAFSRRISRTSQQHGSQNAQPLPWWGRQPSILPAEWETKRVAIAKEHNKWVMVTLVVLFAILFLLVLLVGRKGYPTLIGMIVAVGLAECYAIYRIIEHDKQMCRELGFMCPQCHKPLYDPHSFMNVNGKCPKCRQQIFVDEQRSVALG